MDWNFMGLIDLIDLIDSVYVPRRMQILHSVTSSITPYSGILRTLGLGDPPPPTTPGSGLHQIKLKKNQLKSRHCLLKCHYWFSCYLVLVDSPRSHAAKQIVICIELRTSKQWHPRYLPN